MGWREGQGIGPKEQRQLETGTGGSHCPVKTQGESSSGTASGGDAQWAFAPRDVDVSDMPAMVGRHGLGYTGMDPGRTAVLQTKMRANPSAKLKISGQAFGVGAYEEEDADVYDVDDMSTFDQTMGASDQADPFFGWSGSHDQHLDGGDSLTAFAKAKRPQPPRRIFRSPDLPREFKPFHYFKEGALKSASNLGLVEKSLSANTRGQLLGEQRLQDMSVLSLLSPEDRDRLAHAKQQQQQQGMKSSSSPATSLLHQSEQISMPPPPQKPTARVLSGMEAKSQPPPEPAVSKPAAPSQAAAAAVASASLASRFSSSLSRPSGPGPFKPYASDPEKQRRYEAVASGHAYARAPYMTEWEEQREREEFSRAAELYRPLGGAMAARFTPAKNDDDKDDDPTMQKESVLSEHVADPSDQMSAARANRFGQLTRTVLEWHPDRTVCKRFNVPDPYPKSTFTGLRIDKVDRKANFLNMDFAAASQAQAPAQAITEEEPMAALPPPPASTATKELSSFEPVASSGGSQEAPTSTTTGGSVSFQVSTTPLKPRHRPVPSGPLSVLNKPAFTSAAERAARAQSAAQTKGASSSTSDKPAASVEKATARSSSSAAAPSSGRKQATGTEEQVVSSTTVSVASNAAVDAEEAETEPERPAIDFFKAIFASDSEEAAGGSSSSDDEDGDEDNATDIGKDSSSAVAVDGGTGSKGDTSTTQTEEMTSGSPPRHAFVPRVKRHQEAAPQESDEEEFGPALPPAMPSTAHVMDDGNMQHASSDSKRDHRKNSHKDKKHKKKHKKKEKKSKKSKKTRHHESRYDDGSSDSDGGGSSSSEVPVSASGSSFTTAHHIEVEPSSKPAPSSNSVVRRPRASDFM